MRREPLPRNLDRVTAGLPGLNPGKRRRTAVVERTREITRQALIQELESHAVTVADDGGIPTTSMETQLGHPLSSAQIKARLLVCNPNLLFQVSNGDPTKIGIYIPSQERDPATRGWQYGQHFLCGMERGYSPEFSVRHVERKRIPDPNNIGNWKEVETFKQETRGWRTVLARLIRARVISPTAAEKHFDLSRPSANWKALTT